MYSKIIIYGKWLLLWVAIFCCSEVAAQSRARKILTKVDSVLTARYYRHGSIDTAYIERPKTKWTLMARLNISGAKIESEGVDADYHFNSEMKADYKSTISIGVNYLGFSLSASLNPAKLMGKYRDYELNFRSYGKRFGFDLIYQDAKNFTGWHEGHYEAHPDDVEHIDLPADLLSVKTLNLNAYYVFNSRKFSYPAAFSQSYIQRQSAGSFMLAASGMGQHATLKWEKEMQLKMTNIGIGGGYGYNYVPSQDWLLHISALPTFIVYSNTSMTFGDTKVPLSYHFPEVIITGRGAVVHQWKNKFLGLSMVFNFTNIGNKDRLTVHNIKWRVQTFFGFRL